MELKMCKKLDFHPVECGVSPSEMTLHNEISTSQATSSETTQVTPWDANQDEQ